MACLLPAAATGLLTLTQARARTRGSTAPHCAGLGLDLPARRRSQRGLDIVPVLNQFLPRAAFSPFNEDSGNSSAGPVSAEGQVVDTGEGDGSSGAFVVRSWGGAGAAGGAAAAGGGSSGEVGGAAPSGSGEAAGSSGGGGGSSGRVGGSGGGGSTSSQGAERALVRWSGAGAGGSQQQQRQLGQGLPAGARAGAPPGSTVPAAAAAGPPAAAVVAAARWDTPEVYGRSSEERLPAGSTVRAPGSDPGNPGEEEAPASGAASNKPRRWSGVPPGPPAPPTPPTSYRDMLLAAFDGGPLGVGEGGAPGGAAAEGAQAP